MRKTPAGGTRSCGVGRDAAGRVEAVLEARAQLVEVLLEAPAGGGAGRVLDLDPEPGGEQQAFDLGHGRDQVLALALAQGGQERGRVLVGALVEEGELGLAGGRQPGRADPPVGRARRTSISRSRSSVRKSRLR